MRQLSWSSSLCPAADACDIGRLAVGVLAGANIFCASSSRGGVADGLLFGSGAGAAARAAASSSRVLRVLTATLPWHEIWNIDHVY